MKPRSLPILLASLAALGGCASLTDTYAPAVAGYDHARSKLQLPVQRNLTPFTDGLRCMDQMLQRHAVSMSVLIEDIPDKTGGKAAAGTQDMLLAAFSQMTQRSGASIRTVAYGADLRNLVELMRLSGNKTAFQPGNVPAFAVRGSVSQFDESLARATVDGGLSIGPFGRLGIGGGAARSTSVNLIAADLALVDAATLSLVPGVSTHNVAAIVQQGQGVDAEVSYHKRLGANFSSSIARSDGRSVAMRNLIEWSAIELTGRYARLPYWQCIGVPASHPEIDRMIDDWVASTNVAERLRLLLAHFRRVGLFAGEGEVDPALFKMAFRAYAEALGADPESISDALLKAHFAGDACAAGERARQRYERELRELPVLELGFVPPGQRDAGFVLALSRPAHVHCFAKAGTAGFKRLAPSPRATPMAAGQRLRLRELTTPGSPGLDALAAAPASLVCLALADDRSQQLSDLWQQLQRRQPRLGLAAIDSLRRQLAAQGGYVAMAVLGVQAAGGR